MEPIDLPTPATSLDIQLRQKPQKSPHSSPDKWSTNSSPTKSQNPPLWKKIFPWSTPKAGEKDSVIAPAAENFPIPLFQTKYESSAPPNSLADNLLHETLISEEELIKRLNSSIIISENEKRHGLDHDHEADHSWDMNEMDHGNTVDNHNINVNELNTLLPSDLLMEFSSPSLLAKSNLIVETNLTETNGKLTLSNNHLNPITESTLSNFTQKDMDLMKAEMKETFDKEFEYAQMEIQDLEEKYQLASTQNRKIQETLNQWEIAMNQMIETSRSEKEEHSRLLDLSRMNNEKLSNEKERIESEADIIHRKYKQIRIDFIDLKEIHDKQVVDFEQQEKQLLTWKTNYETLKNHAQSKMNEANSEIKRVRETYEKEISTLKAKLARSELLNTSLSQTIETKTKENTELTKLCDELLAQIES